MQDYELLKAIDARSLENREEIVKLKECQVMMRRDVDEQGESVDAFQTGMNAIHSDMLLIKNQLARHQQAYDRISTRVMGLLIAAIVGPIIGPVVNPIINPHQQIVSPAVMDKLESIEDRLD